MSRDREVHNDDSITLPHRVEDIKWGYGDVLMLCYSADCGTINKSQSNVNAIANGHLPLLSQITLVPAHNCAGYGERKLYSIHSTLFLHRIYFEK